MNFIRHRLILGALVMAAVFALCDALRAEPVAQSGEGSLEQRAHRIKLPNFTFKNATPAEVLKTLSEASGIPVFYTPAEWDKASLTFNFYTPSAWSAFYQFAEKANLKISYREDGVYFQANPHARNDFLTPDTVEYKAEMTAIPKVDWNGVTPTGALNAITAATGIKAFYKPRETDRPSIVVRQLNVGAALAFRMVAQVAGLRISYQADGVYLEPGDWTLNDEHASARWRAGLPVAKDIVQTASLASDQRRVREAKEREQAGIERLARTSMVKAGDAAPDFTCKTISGEEFTLSNEKGKVVLIDFFATWCGPCVAELPRLEKEVFQKYAGRKDFKMLLLGEGHQVPELEKFGREKSCFMPIAPDAGKEIFAKYASESIPRRYIIGRDGNIKLASAGFTESIFQEVVQALQKELEAPHMIAFLKLLSTDEPSGNTR